MQKFGRRQARKGILGRFRRHCSATFNQRGKRLFRKVGGRDRGGALADEQAETDLLAFRAPNSLKLAEPHLYAMLIRYCNRSIPDESVSDETQTRIYDAIWCGMLVAVESYRVAQFHLWAETCLGPQMERLHPDIASRRFTAAYWRRRQDKSAEDGDADNDESDGDEGAVN